MTETLFLTSAQLQTSRVGVLFLPNTFTYINSLLDFQRTPAKISDASKDWTPVLKTLTLLPSHMGIPHFSCPRAQTEPCWFFPHCQCWARKQTYIQGQRLS